MNTGVGMNFLSRCLAGLSAFITLFIWTPLFDPINLPKASVLMIAGVPILSSVLIRSNIRDQKAPLFLALAFVAAATWSTLMSDQGYTSLWGTHGRQNGLVSYLALAMFFLAAALLTRDVLTRSLFVALQVTASIVAFYALIQIVGLDWIQWKNPYNPAVTTLGNPNFTAAFLGMAAAALFSYAFLQQVSRRSIVTGLASLALVVVIWFTDSIQGIVGALAGVAVLVTLFYLRHRFYVGLGLLISLAVLGAVTIASFWGLGPLGGRLQQETLLIRGNYWRAAIGMFKDHWLTGVGLDRYGAYFAAYRDSGAIETGNNVVTDAAHNIYLHFAATGGLPLLLAYSAIQITILIVTLKRLWSDGFELNETSLFVAWLVFQFQSLISIDQLGISVWGWVLGGALLARALPDREEEPEPQRRKRRRSAEMESRRSMAGTFAAVFVSTVTTVALLANLGPMWRADKDLSVLGSVRKAPDEEEAAVILASERIIGHRAKDPFYTSSVATWLAERGDLKLADRYAVRALDLDPREVMMWRIRAFVKNAAGDKAGELDAIQKALELDPLNTELLAKEAELKG